jgi:branched-subunit amino acid aminotransferase/4-amino-4-deoxychorismate lyase
MGIVFSHGELLAEEDARVPISDRGFQCGDGAYATIQVREGIPLFLDVHLKLLQKQCSSFHLTMPIVEKKSIWQLIESNRAFDDIWRLKIFITGGDSPEHRLPERTGRVYMILKPFTPQPFKPLKMGIFPIPYYSCHASFKSLAHLNRFYVMEEAFCQGVDDCVTVTEKEWVLEAAFGNLFWIKGTAFFTPDPKLPLYFGVTIQHICQLAIGLGFEIHYVECPFSEIPLGATAFRTSTMQGIRPIVQIGKIPFIENPIIQAMFTNGYEMLILEQKKEQLAQAALNTSIMAE